MKVRLLHVLEKKINKGDIPASVTMRLKLIEEAQKKFNMIISLRKKLE